MFETLHFIVNEGANRTVIANKMLETTERTCNCPYVRGFVCALTDVKVLETWKQQSADVHRLEVRQQNRFNAIQMKFRISS
jgi:hypothetical protein